MAPFFNAKPENAIKRAEELISLGQQPAALNLLLDFILSKRFRSTPIANLEPIMFKFVQLSVDLRKGKNVKEGLHQYKNITQNVAITAIETVIKQFITLSEAKVTEAQSKADTTLIAIELEDLEDSETPEQIMLATVSGDGNKDRTDRELVTPWLKFLWEAYRTALDILRNNSRLEILYQSVANQAFQFCLKYVRKTEFRRLCDLLRQHLTSSSKYSNQQHSINLSESDTLQRYLDTRFVQLNAAIQLDLWQESFRSIEDIHSLLSTTKKPKQFILANYYEKLAEIFRVGDNWLMHAAAWNKHYLTIRQSRQLSDEEHARMSSFVLISALAIPISTSSNSRSYGDMDDNKSEQRLVNLLRASKTPTRELNKNIIARVRPELKQLHEMLEVKFHPLSICKKIGPILKTLLAIPELAAYVKPLHSVILTRLLTQLSQVYTKIRLDAVVKLAALPEPYNYDAHKIEMFILQACRRGDLNIRLNHQTQTLSFTDDHGDISKSLATDTLRQQLDQLAKRLLIAVVKIRPEIERFEEERKAAIDLARERSEAERQETFDRRVLIEKKKEYRENLLAQKEREEAVIRMRAQAEAAEAEKIRMEAESRRREEERLKAHRAEIEKQEKLKMAAKLAEELQQKNLKVKGDLSTLDTDKLVQLQQQQLENERRDAKMKIKMLSRRHDHLQRAFKKEEIPLLEKDYEKQKKLDRAYHKAMVEAKKTAAKLQHEENMKIKARLERMMPEYLDFRKGLLAKRDEEYNKKLKVAQAQLEEEKQARREQVLARLEKESKEREARLAEEKKRKEREEQEAKGIVEPTLEREERDRLRKEKERLDREKFEARRKKLDEQAALQAERERRAEEKIRSSRSGASPPRARDEGGWRQSASGKPIPGSVRASASSASMSRTSSSGAYVPSGRRGAGERPSDRYNDRSDRDRQERTDDGPGNWRQGPPLSRTSSSSSMSSAPMSRTGSSGGKFVPPHLRNKQKDSEDRSDGRRW